MSPFDESSEIVYVSGSIFDTETVIAIEENFSPPVLSVNGQIGHISLNIPTGFDSARIENVVYTTGNQEISGVKSFDSKPTFSGNEFLVEGEAYGLNNPSGFVTDSEIQNYLTGFITENDLTGITGYVESPIKKFLFDIESGAILFTGTFNTKFNTIPVVSASIQTSGDYQYSMNFFDITTSGFVAIFSDQVTESGVKLNIIAY